MARWRFSWNKAVSGLGFLGGDLLRALGVLTDGPLGIANREGRCPGESLKLAVKYSVHTLLSAAPGFSCFHVTWFLLGNSQGRRQDG